MVSQQRRPQLKHLFITTNTDMHNDQLNFIMFKHEGKNKHFLGGNFGMKYLRRSKLMPGNFQRE
jgi:hypothetical protein